MAHSVTLIAIPLAMLLWTGGLVGGAMSPSGWGAPIALMLILALNIGQMGILAALLASYAWAPGKPAFGG